MTTKDISAPIRPNHCLMNFFSFVDLFFRLFKNKKLINPGFPAAHPEPAYRCFLPDLTGFTGPRLRRTRAHERIDFIDTRLRCRSADAIDRIWRRGWDLNPR